MPQSAELGAGSGFTFETLVAARYLASLLTETGAPGSDGVVTGVALQQRENGEPLDDVIVDFCWPNGTSARVSLQCKTGITISDAAANTDFREIVRDSVKTLQKPGFREDVDRYGAAVGNVAAGKFKTLTKLCELARSDDTAALFDVRFAPSGSTAKELKEVRYDIATLLQQELGGDYRPEIVHRFLRHFVVVRFDYLHEGAVDSPEAINAVRAALPLASAATDAPALWSVLCQIAREEASRAAQFSRPSLVCRLGRRVRLVGAPSLRGDLAKLAYLAADWVQDIEDSVRGTRLAREALSHTLDAVLAQERFVQVRGLPGSGKSVLLRRRIEADLQNGPVLFLKSERLEGKSWSSFARAVGLSDAPLSDLLVELAAVSTAVLYIDGIDRIDKDHQGVVADLVRQILTNPLLENWRIVISLRDAGSEPLRTWLPDLFTKGRLGTVEVGLLDDDEAKALAEGQSALSPLLFGSEPVKEIVRRPFFAKILSQALTGPASGAVFAPVSEVDLIDNWWARGGFNSSGSAAILRQRALVELAALRVRDLSQPLALAAMNSGTVALLEEFASDGILQVVRAGHSVRFAHDIFFEWALYHLLVDHGEGWLEEIRAAGEPPLAGRVVELLSQADFVADRSWDKTLARLEASDLRSQWTRAWLLGPVFAPTFDDHSERYFVIGARDKYLLLGKALVWFQAEKTVPNAAILEGRIGSATLKRHEIVRLADTLGWPSDYAAWRRFITLMLDHIADIPVALIPDVVVVFEVWQNALADLRNAVSQRLLAQCAIWLKTIEQRRHRRWRQLSEDEPREDSAWDDFDGDGDDLEGRLRSLVLRGVRVRPNLVTEYLDDLKEDGHRLDKVFKGVVLYAPFLALGHAASLVDISLLHFREELPEDHIRQEEEELRRANERRRRAKATPENERTREDELILSGEFSILGSSFNSYEWERLAVDKDKGNYFPASPLREPFNSLFQAAPSEALRLIKGVSNHAMLAWRQLHAVDPQRPLRKPIPIVIDFPWGRQEFWGTGREYLWYRGLWAPKLLAGAYQAMERWTLAALDAGRKVDEVIAEVVNGHDCVAVLGIAVSLMLKSQAVTPVTAALVRCQRLWRYDLERMGQDRSMDSISAIGWRGASDLPHYEALKALNALPHRKLWLRELVGLFLLSPDRTLAERTRVAIAAFPTDLPYQYEEQRANPDFTAALLEDAQFNAEFANPDNVKTAIIITEEHGEAEVTYIDNPQTRDPKVRQRLADANESAQTHTLWFWADKSLKEAAMASEVAYDRALIFAQRIEGRDLFKAGGNDRVEHTMRQGAVAGMAAVVLKYRASFGAHNLAWARKVLARAAKAPEISDGMWSSGAVIPWHPSISVAKAMGFEIAEGAAVESSKRQLLRLIAHPLDGAALEALQQCLALWEDDTRFAWCALWEALALCQFTTSAHEASARIYDPAYIAAKKAVQAEEAIAHFGKKEFWPTLPAMPPAWVEVEGAKPAGRSFVPDVEEIDDDVAVNPRRWRQPDTVFDWNLAAKVLALAPVAAVFAHVETRRRFLDFARALLGWVLDKMAPPWKKSGRRERIQNLGHLDAEVGNLFARLAVVLDSEAFSDLFFAPIFALEDELCYDLLSPFLSAYVCIAVYDAEIMPADAVATIQSCLERVLKDRVFDPRGYRAGELYGHHLPYMIRSFLFVSADNAGGAMRFANGDWSDIGLVMPIVDRLVRTAGWASSVMHDYLTLVERARDVYPTETFADQILTSLSGGRESLKGWRGLYLPARIAGLVQCLAFRDSPMPTAVAQKLLRILDILVDMGDRRSAALQISDPFREVQRPGG